MNKPERNFRKAILTAPITRDEAERICAVEGLHLTPEMRDLLDKADDDGADFLELERRIDAAFGLVRD